MSQMVSVRPVSSAADMVARHLEIRARLAGKAVRVRQRVIPVVVYATPLVIPRQTLAERREEELRRLTELRRVAAVEEALKDFDDSRIGAVTMRDCIREVCTFYGVPRDQLLAAGRGRDLAKPRHVAAALAHELTGKSTIAIGREMDRDHSSIFHAIKKVARLCQTDPAFAKDVATIRDRLTA